MPSVCTEMNESKFSHGALVSWKVQYEKNVFGRKTLWNKILISKQAIRCRQRSYRKVMFSWASVCSRGSLVPDPMSFIGGGGGKASLVLCPFQGCARFADLCANSCVPWLLFSLDYNGSWKPARWKTAKIHQNEHTPGGGGYILSPGYLTPMIPYQTPPEGRRDQRYPTPFQTNNFNVGYLFIFLPNKCIQWRSQDFPEGAPTPKVGVLTYFFCRKMYENERILTPKGSDPGDSLDPPVVFVEYLIKINYCSNRSSGRVVGSEKHGIFYDLFLQSREGAWPLGPLGSATVLQFNFNYREIALQVGDS